MNRDRLTWVKGYGPNGSPVWIEPSIALVVPSNRPTCLQDWHAAWDPYLKANDLRGEVTVYDVLDQEETWDTIQTALGDAAWIIPRQSDCVRMWGFLRAMRNGADLIITMDDDCYPDDPLDGLTQHVIALTDRIEPRDWFRPVHDLMTRGLPRLRSVVFNHGLWTGVPDLSGADQLAGHWPTPGEYPHETIVPMGAKVPLSGMNCAFPVEWLPAYYMGLMGSHLITGEPWGVDRYGDIWAGLAVKRIADHLGAAVRSGTPFVSHQRASDPVVNAARETAGEFWTPDYASALWGTPLPRSHYVDDHAIHLASALTHLRTPYWQQYSAAWSRWIALTGRGMHTR